MAQEKYENPFALHAFEFSDEAMNFSSTTVGDGLARHHGKQPYVKGTVIALFNASHVCPFSKSGAFVPENGSYGKFLHLGTTRIWNEKGLIDEDKWNELVSFISKDQENTETKIVKLSKLYEYLELRISKDPEETTTGRNTNSFFSSASLQHTAARKGWLEVFELLGANTNDKDPCIPLTKVRHFFENFKAALAKEMATKNSVQLDQAVSATP